MAYHTRNQDSGTADQLLPKNSCFLPCGKINLQRENLSPVTWNSSLFRAEHPNPHAARVTWKITSSCLSFFPSFPSDLPSLLLCFVMLFFLAYQLFSVPFLIRNSLAPTCLVAFFSLSLPYVFSFPLFFPIPSFSYNFSSSPLLCMPSSRLFSHYILRFSLSVFSSLLAGGFWFFAFYISLLPSFWVPPFCLYYNASLTLYIFYMLLTHSLFLLVSRDE